MTEVQRLLKLVFIFQKKANFHCRNDGFVFAEEVPENVDLPPIAIFKTYTEFYNPVQVYTR